jgi:hypothetical protein
MYRDEDGIHLFHSIVTVRWPVQISWNQFLLTIGHTCPRHRAILKRKLGPFGRLLPNREWRDGGWRDVDLHSRLRGDL